MEIHLRLFRVALILVTGALLLRSGEFLVHLRNKKYMSVARPREVASAWMQAYLGLEWLVFFALLAECFYLPKVTMPWQQIAGVIFLVFGMLLRYWARRALGRAWNLKLIYVPGMERVETGPYKYMAHPEYLSRFVEILGLSIFVGSYLSLGLYVGGICLLLPRIIILENRQLRSLGAPGD